MHFHRRFTLPCAEVMSLEGVLFVAGLPGSEASTHRLAKNLAAHHGAECQQLRYGPTANEYSSDCIDPGGWKPSIGRVSGCDVGFEKDGMAGRFVIWTTCIEDSLSYLITLTSKIHFVGLIVALLDPETFRQLAPALPSLGLGSHGFAVILALVMKDGILTPNTGGWPLSGGAILLSAEVWGVLADDDEPADALLQRVRAKTWAHWSYPVSDDHPVSGTSPPSIKGRFLVTRRSSSISSGLGKEFMALVLQECLPEIPPHKAPLTESVVPADVREALLKDTERRELPNGWLFDGTFYIDLNSGQRTRLHPEMSARLASYVSARQTEV
ncbi:hypothetical protein FOZ63_033858, partial [Perkinsus olseni]